MKSHLSYLLALVLTATLSAETANGKETILEQLQNSYKPPKPLTPRQRTVKEPDRGRTVTGLANVIDGDTININGRDIGLTFIDAPELGQLCHKTKKMISTMTSEYIKEDPFDGGKFASEALKDVINNQIVTCHLMPDAEEFGDCSLPGIPSLSMKMAELGMVYNFSATKYEREHGFLEYSYKIRKTAEHAKNRQIGIWGESSKWPRCLHPAGVRNAEGKPNLLQ